MKRDGRWESRNTFHTDLGNKMKVFSVLADGKEGHKGNGFHKHLLFPFYTCKSVFANFLICFLNLVKGLQINIKFKEISISFYSTHALSFSFMSCD